ncbi:hypothetical protein K474DRAFT_186826 [Panus rudis PR-1116 ss-1]|nr:hypothetical protein K474DRAFT_186826 [Panus rudis PR-1116 ss-1]
MDTSNNTQFIAFGVNSQHRKGKAMPKYSTLIRKVTDENGNPQPPTRVLKKAFKPVTVQNVKPKLKELSLAKDHPVVLPPSPPSLVKKVVSKPVAVPKARDPLKELQIAPRVRVPTSTPTSVKKAPIAVKPKVSPTVKRSVPAGKENAVKPVVITKARAQLPSPPPSPPVENVKQVKAVRMPATVSKPVKKVQATVRPSGVAVKQTPETKAKVTSVKATSGIRKSLITSSAKVPTLVKGTTGPTVQKNVVKATEVVLETKAESKDVKEVKAVKIEDVESRELLQETSLVPSGDALCKSEEGSPLTPPTTPVGINYESTEVKRMEAASETPVELPATKAHEPALTLHRAMFAQLLQGQTSLKKVESCKKEEVMSVAVVSPSVHRRCCMLIEVNRSPPYLVERIGG